MKKITRKEFSEITKKKVNPISEALKKMIVNEGFEISLSEWKSIYKTHPSTVICNFQKKNAIKIMMATRNKKYYILRIK